MKYVPIEGKILSKDTTLYVGFGEVELYYEKENGDTHWLWSDAHTIYANHIITLSELENVFKNLLQQDMHFLLKIDTPLSDETYEYSKSDDQWHLVKRGWGFA